MNFGSTYFPGLGLVSSLFALVYPHWLFTSLMFLSTYQNSLRYRGTFNGGSDTTTLHVLGAVGIWQMSPGLERTVALYIAVFVSLSYFVAGVSKLFSGQWRSGEALPCFLLYSNAACSNTFTSVLLQSRWLYMASWLVVIWECLFPVGLLFPSAAWILASLGLVFHLMNFCFFGLNRFFWAWLAAYPALLSIHHVFK